MTIPAGAFTVLILCALVLVIAAPIVLIGLFVYDLTKDRLW